MSVEVRVPQLGESIVEATVGRWLKLEGDNVTTGDPLVELETDKVNMEVTAIDSGTLEKIEKAEGATVAIGDVLARIAETSTAGGNGTGPQKPAPLQASSASSEAPSQIAAPEPSVSSPPSTDTALPEISAGDGETSRSATGQRGATPLARRIAAEHGVDISDVEGTGPSGRVTRDDVAAHLDRAGQAAVAADLATAAPSAPAESARTEVPATQIPGDRPEERIHMSRRRQTIARRLVQAQHDAAMLTTFNEVDMTAIMDIRKRRREAFKERHGIGLGFMSFFAKAVIGALKEYPRLNAEIQGDDMILKHYYDIGIAVGTDEGLVVPVVRDADRLSFAEIERQIVGLASRARDRRLTLEELQGGTFTITNGGIYGSLMSTPILNAPQVGILGMHKIEERPVVVEGQVVVRPMMYLAVSYDHRIVDGSEAVRFLVRIKDLVEDPGLLLIEG
jgi:2-oxoglutarate dehydrogenase E2 component (dihydrolipoamide succinyltransferase)